jgi:hypothetical protein
MDLINLNNKIKKIYLQVEKTIDKSNSINNQIHDELAIKHFEEFIIELTKYHGKTKTDINSYLNYLNSKYLACELDPLDPTVQVRIIRKTIAKILDSISQV